MLDVPHQLGLGRAFVRALVLLLATAAGTASAEGPAIDFNRDIRPILSNACFACHGPDAAQRKGASKPLRLDTEEGALADLGGYAAIVPGKPDASELVTRVRSDDPNEVMPPPRSGHKRPSPQEIDRLTKWIEQGARYARHWSYVKPSRPNPPLVKDSAWSRNPVDRFLLEAMEREGLSPSPEADRSTLIRRVALDLTGLPPSVEEVEAFTRDIRPDAYERLVDGLLSSPAYGERWGAVWLDLARYADSAGYADDPPRTIWAYRDRVIRAFNANTPFDQLTLEQIAGDLLPNPTEESLVASAFHRNTTTNNEGGTNDEEFRSAAVVDRVNTTLAVWMGTTIACAQCHDHKYDPISQADYFRLYAFFNNTADADRGDESPTLPLYTADQKAQRAGLSAEVERLVGLSRLTAEPIPWSVAASALKASLVAIKPVTTVPIQRELAGNARRTTRIQRRGNFLDLGEPVVEGVPEAIFPWPAEVRRDRLALARWLVAPENPLTARVLANRLWEQVFGAGLVPTVEDFGSQGDPPTHPELLDWLATELVDQGWDLKRFLKMLVCSSAYRQTSRVTPQALAADPTNRWLARGPRFRLSAEMVRDQALSVSGLLVSRMHGPPVRPPQPSSGLSAAFGGQIDWKPSVGDDRYRRAIYTSWRRSNPYPSMTTFDAPNRDVCTTRRTRTNTPLQALVTLNDPVFVEAAQALGRRVAAGGGDLDAKLDRLVRLTLSRAASGAELARLSRLFHDAKAGLASDPEAAGKLATDPLGPTPPGADRVELAAWTVVANVVLNLDETLMKR
jgi:cytochrome c553